MQPDMAETECALPIQWAPKGPSMSSYLTEAMADPPPARARLRAHWLCAGALVLLGGTVGGLGTVTGDHGQQQSLAWSVITSSILKVHPWLHASQPTETGVPRAGWRSLAPQRLSPPIQPVTPRAASKDTSPSSGHIDPFFLTLELNEEEIEERKQAKLVSTTLPRPLTDEEEELFNFFLWINEYYNLNAELRVAGGWVRDKMLQRPPNDIDITVEGPKPNWVPGRRKLDAPYLTGMDFYNFIIDAQRAAGEQTEGYGYLPVSEAESRFLPLAVGKLYGFEIALTHLCKGGSSSAKATPEEDSWRRDLTINSLFYNLRTQKVEDWTGKGLEDLRLRRIRTPMAPLRTFYAYSVTPARPLRAIRFACRLNFTLDPNIIAAARQKRVREDLMARVTREKMGRELKEVLSGPDPHRGVALLRECGLEDVVFMFHPPLTGRYPRPEDLVPYSWAKDPQSEQSWEQSARVLQAATRSAPYQQAEDVEKRLAMTFASLFYGMSPAPDMSLTMNEQGVEMRQWFMQVVTYPFKIRKQVATAASRYVVALRNMDALAKPLHSEAVRTNTTAFNLGLDQFDGHYEWHKMFQILGWIVPNGTDSSSSFVLALHEALGGDPSTRELVHQLAGLQPKVPREAVPEIMEWVDVAPYYWERPFRCLQNMQMVYPTYDRRQLEQAFAAYVKRLRARRAQALAEAQASGQNHTWEWDWTSPRPVGYGNSSHPDGNATTPHAGDGRPPPPAGSSGRHPEQPVRPKQSSPGLAPKPLRAVAPKRVRDVQEDASQRKTPRKRD
uniref:Poly A polymerase head domain-containing protein n=1 Tax=Eutreptiella gymnastica TaxID=73025 RepID=A0A7S1JB15_9EUGL|mmetsp:Transcript_8134/g.14445  ORF Transcript_8134/g.14445 Transcript_8134/m.14445 type:complete len:784 (+) Transcript_8134:36-2387(+)